MSLDHDLRDLPWIAAAGLAVAWRLAAPFTQRAELRAGTISSADYRSYLILAAMGLVFVALGAVARRAVRSRESRLFALYAALAALHWGGPLTSDRPILGVYFLLSGILAQTVLFHFVWLFPPRSAGRDPGGWLYLPAVLAAVAGGVASLGGEATADTAVTVFGLLHAAASNLFPLGAIVVAVVRTLRAGTEERARLLPLAGGLVLGVVPYLAVNLLAAGEPGPVLATGANLFFVLIPLGGCRALLRGRSTAALAPAEAPA